LPFMSQPYIDSLFNAAGLTDNFQNMIEQSNIIQDKVDGVYDKNIKKAVAGAIDKVVLEAPQELVKFIGSKLAQLVGLSAGDDIGKTMAGACKPMVGSCDTAKGEIQRTLADGVQECCDTGQALVCTNKCRPIGLEACKETSGEKQFNINGNKCCFDTQVTAGSDEECYKCRELVGDPAGGKCERDGELKPITRTDSAGKEIKLCCKPRAIDECQQVTAIEGMPELVCDIKGGEIFQNRKNASDETASFCCKAKPEEGSNGAIYNERFCCETITDCINDKFLKHMEMMKDYLLDGPPLSSLYDEEE